MEWIYFIASIVDSLAWPIVLLILVFTFRPEMLLVLDRISSFRYKDFEFDLDKVREQAQELPVELRTDKLNPILFNLADQMRSTVETSPGAAILLAWSGLEAAVTDVISRLSISPEPSSFKSAGHNIEMLAKYTNASKRFIDLLNGMRILRNKVAHNKKALMSLSQDQALGYVQTTRDIMQYLASLEYVETD